jgi:two-component system response regulator YesN
MATRHLLWVDLRSSPGLPDLCSSLPRVYEAVRVSQISKIFAALQSCNPFAVCFEYERPDRQGLGALSETKDRFSSVPIVMLTGHHDEAMAQWVLKRCVWDYLVKPLPVRRLCDSLMGIYRAKLCASVPSWIESREAYSPAAPMLSAPIIERQRTLARALSYVETNYAEKIQLATVARICNLSPFQFSRNFKKENGITFRDFVVRLRIQRAAQLMRESGASVTEAAFVVGFNDLSYFARMFRRQLGVSPSQYRDEAEPVQLSLFSKAA